MDLLQGTVTNFWIPVPAGVGTPPWNAVLSDAAGNNHVLDASAGVLSGFKMKLATTMASTAVLGPYVIVLNDDTATELGHVTGRIVSVAGGGIDAAGVRAAVGLTTANLDDQLAGVVTGPVGLTPAAIGEIVLAIEQAGPIPPPIPTPSGLPWHN
jgi:hypothetical protein